MPRKASNKSRVPALLKKKTSKIVKKAVKNKASKAKPIVEAPIAEPVEAAKPIEAENPAEPEAAAQPDAQIESVAAADPFEGLNIPQSVSKSLQRVPGEYAFWVCNGTYVHDLHELADVIESMGENEFKQHVNEDKNDFSNWIRDVIGELELAEKLAGTLDQRDHQVHVLKHLVKELRK